MNLAEMRDTLKKYQSEELRQIIVEMYRAAPKKIRDEKHFDDMILDNEYDSALRKNIKIREAPKIVSLL